MKKNLLNPATATAALTLTALAVITTNAAAQGIVDNTANNQDNSIRVSGPSYPNGQVIVAQSFTTGADATSLTAITPDFTGSTGSAFQLALYSDNGGTPGSQISVLSGAGSPGTGFQTYSSSGIALAPGTTYWWVASDSGNDNFYLGMTDGSGYTTTDGWSINSAAAYNLGSGWNADGSYQLLFSANATLVPAPEPSAEALIGLGLGAGAVFFRRRKVP